MCGLAGWFRLDVAQERRASLLEAMCATIAHRGPDDHGVYIEGPVALGFRRLSIVDLDGGHQPMASDDRGIVITFNGEIFNHGELRDGLIREGVRFRTRSDTEVILRLYERFGVAAFDHMNGMFAVAIWDRRHGTLHLVRDRFGGLVFGSEIKALLACGQIEKAISPGALWNYLTFRYVPGPGSIWRSIQKLPPAHRLEFRLDRDAPTVTRWWDMAMMPNSSPRSDGEYLEEFTALFEDAVRLRLQADVPVGVTLSGGLDSSAVVAAAHPTTPHTFSVAFADSPQTDELAYARRVSKAFGTAHHEVVIDEKTFLETLPEFVWHTDEPLADLASIPLFHVSKLARRHVKVVLSGEGADEIFAGYDFDRWARRWHDIAVARDSTARFGRILSPLLARFSAAYGQRAALASEPLDQRMADSPISMTNLWSSSEKISIFRGGFNGIPDSLDIVRDHVRRLGDRPPLNQVLYSYCQDWLAEDLLMKADKMSMAASLELRTPFLDYRLAEWAARLPVALKAGPDPAGRYRTKEIVRRYAEARLPPEIVARPKQGFPVPVYEWLSGRLKGWARDILLDPRAKIAAWIEPAALRRAYDDATRAESGPTPRHRLWSLLVLELWMRRWTA
jgi:asparagine synthase (glutamine-hydrolysing)